MMISKFETESSKKIDFPMTRERYLSAWKIFRAISDENLITANHIVALDIWTNITSILDVGTGDGLIAKSVTLHSPEDIEKVILIDPDKEMLAEAYLHLSEIDIIHDIQKEPHPFEHCFHKHVRNVDIVLVIHVVYLLTDRSFQFLLDNLPVGKKLIVILDDDNSIFSKLWRVTAPKYFNRSVNVRTFLGNPLQNYSVHKTIITSKIINPLHQRDHIKNSILSLMCYSDFSLMDDDRKNFVQDCISENVKGRFVECTSACYEIIRIS